MPNGRDNVSADTVYSELYEEGRYFRNHELTVSTWYIVILLAILTTFLAIKSSSPDSAMYILSSNLLVKICIVVIVSVIGGNALLSVRYSRKRYDDIRHHLNKMEPPNKNFIKTEMWWTPRKFISITLAILKIVIICIIIFIP